MAGKFSDSPYSGLLCYDRNNGYAAFYETDGSSHISLMQEHFDWRSSWTHIIPGVFGDSGYDGILLYDQEAGFAAFYDTDGQGSLVLLREYNDWPTSWTHVVVAPFTDSKYSGFLLYDKSAGVLAIYATDGRGGMTLSFASAMTGLRDGHISYGKILLGSSLDRDTVSAVCGFVFL